MAKSLTAVVAEKPFQEFAEWWTMGNVFVSFMSDAIYDQWQSLAGRWPVGLSVIREYMADTSTPFSIERQGSAWWIASSRSRVEFIADCLG